MSKISKKFIRMSNVYRHFSLDWVDCLDYSADMLLEMYKAENGEVKPSKLNGFAQGKKGLNITVAMWKEDIAKGTLFLFELYNDENYPHWWLDRVFKDYNIGLLSCQRL